MLRVVVFNTVCRHFFCVGTCSVTVLRLRRHALQAHPLMLRISQPAQMRRRDIEE